MIICGIDPGFQGGLAFIQPDYAAVTYRMPLIKVDGKSAYDLPRMIGLIAQMGKTPLFVVLEHASAGPGAGATGMFRYGEGFGLWRGVLAALGVPCELVRPVLWKKAMMNGRGKEKREAISRAQELFPQLVRRDPGQTRGLTDGEAEALLLAEWGRRYAVPKENR